MIGNVDFLPTWLFAVRRSMSALSLSELRALSFRWCVSSFAGVVVNMVVKETRESFRCSFLHRSCSPQKNVPCAGRFDSGRVSRQLIRINRPVPCWDSCCSCSVFVPACSWVWGNMRAKKSRPGFHPVPYRVLPSSGLRGEAHASGALLSRLDVASYPHYNEKRAPGSSG